MKISKFLKLNKDILLEYIYNDKNLISEPYRILINTKDRLRGYVSGDSSLTINITDNQLFEIDPVTNKWGIVDTNTYSFLQFKDFAVGSPVRYDILKIHLPVNYTFGEYLGLHLDIYIFDNDNRTKYYLSNFYFDITNIDQSGIINFTSPPILINEKLWGKYIQLEIPSPYSISNQRENNTTKPNSINWNLTDGLGLNLNSPIFLEFNFITSKSTINGVTTYLLGSKLNTSLPIIPEFQNIGVKIEYSKNGDYFEIYGIMDDSVTEFAKFIESSYYLGNRYNVEYVITIYEQNIRGKTIRIYVTDNFNEKIEYRPIIKYSTTTAVIDVEMRIIDTSNQSQILRRASYGMLQDEVSRFSLNLIKINVSGSNTPKIYNIKSPIGAGIFGRGQQFGLTNNNVQLEPIKVPYPVLIEKFNVIAKSESVKIGKNNFWGNGSLQLLIYPFDNVVQIIIASKIDDNQIGYMDLTGSGQINMVMKNNKVVCSFPLYVETGQVDLSIGILIFKINSSKINDLKKIYESGDNLFYITTTSYDTTTVIYTGLFKMYDSSDNISQLESFNEEFEVEAEEASGPALVSISDVSSDSQEPTLSTNLLTQDVNSYEVDTVEENRAVIYSSSASNTIKIRGSNSTTSLRGGGVSSTGTTTNNSTQQVTNSTNKLKVDQILNNMSYVLDPNNIGNIPGSIIPLVTIEKNNIIMKFKNYLLSTMTVDGKINRSNAARSLDDILSKTLYYRLKSIKNTIINRFNEVASTMDL